jgi:hypothetical protein
MPAYTYRSTGTQVSSSSSAPLSPGAPAGKAVGDQLRLFTGNRASGVTLTSLAPDYVEVATFNTSNGSISAWLRIADGSAADTPTVDWSGTNDAYAWIEAHYGDVYTDLATVIAHAATNDNGTTTGSLYLPALTVSVANCDVVVFSQKSKTPLSNDATTITVGGGPTKRSQLILSGTAVAAVSGNWQQTTATNFTGTHPTINGTVEGSMSTTGMAFALNTASAPVGSFVGTPTVTATTDGGIINFTITGGNATVSAVAVIKGSATPTSTQIHAGQNGAGGAALAAVSATATTDVPSTRTLTGLTFPDHDMYIARSTNVVPLLSQRKLPPAGFQYKTITGLPWAAGQESILDGASPAAVDGDVIVVPTHASSVDLGAAAHALSVSGTGLVSVSPATDSSRLSFTKRFYDASVGDFSDGSAITDYINNVAPAHLGTVSPYLFEKDVAITAIPLEPAWGDDDGDALTITFTTALPTGLSNSSETLVGTPTVYGSTDVTERATDVANEFTDQVKTIQVGPRLPNVVNTAQAAAISTIEAIASLDAVLGTSAFSSTIAIGNVVSMSPPASTLVAPNAQVTLVISLGLGVPDVVGLEATIGATLIEAEGFEAVTVYVANAAAAGIIISQSPVAGTAANPGSVVTMTASLGQNGQTAVTVQQYLGTKPSSMMIIRADERVSDSAFQEWYVVGNGDAVGKCKWVLTNRNDSAITQAATIITEMNR